MITESNFIKSFELWNSLDMSFNNTDIYELHKLFCQITHQDIPTRVVDEFIHLPGYNSNLEFLTSDFLSRRGYKNLLQYLKQK